MLKELVSFLTRDEHLFMDVLDIATRNVANDNAANDNEARSSDASQPEVA